MFFSTFYAFTGGKFSPGWRRLSAGGDFRSLSTSAQLYLGVAPRTEVYVVLPYLLNWAADVNMPAPTGQRRADFGGLGNVSVTGKYLLSKEGTYLPAMAGIFTATFPTAHHRHLNPRFLGTDQLGRGAYGFTPGLNFYKHVPPFPAVWQSLVQPVYRCHSKPRPELLSRPADRQSGCGIALHLQPLGLFMGSAQFL